MRPGFGLEVAACGFGPMANPKLSCPPASPSHPAPERKSGENTKHAGGAPDEPSVPAKPCDDVQTMLPPVRPHGLEPALTKQPGSYFPQSAHAQKQAVPSTVQDKQPNSSLNCTGNVGRRRCCRCPSEGSSNLHRSESESIARVGSPGRAASTRRQEVAEHAVPPDGVD